jgi:hypothetical protein
LSPDRIYDGVSLIGRERASTEGRAVYFTFGLGDLLALRHGKYKLHQQHSILRDTELARNRTLGQKEFDGRAGKYMWLVDLEHDPHEAYDASEKHRSVATQMAQLAALWEKGFKKNPCGWKVKEASHS